MEPVKSYKAFLDKLEFKYGNKEKIICLLFVDPSNIDIMSQYITNRFEYLNRRTGKYVDFFCPGYYTFYGERKFNVNDYVDFINQLEELTNWRYYGGTNLLIIRYLNGELYFDSVYDLNFSRMLIDGLINDYQYFMEEIIFNFRDIGEYIDSLCTKKQLGSLWDNFSKFLPDFMQRILLQISDTRKINKYLTPHDIRKVNIRKSRRV